MEIPFFYFRFSEGRKVISKYLQVDIELYYSRGFRDIEKITADLFIFPISLVLSDLFSLLEM
jgi:hypothetical protein